MSRNLILAMGALLWTIVIIAVIGHVMVGETISPALALLGGLVWVAARRAQRAVTAAKSETRVEAS
jgi:predicted dinucleotide-binding enzyme